MDPGHGSMRGLLLIVLVVATGTAAAWGGIELQDPIGDDSECGSVGPICVIHCHDPRIDLVSATVTSDASEILITIQVRDASGSHFCDPIAPTGIAPPSFGGPAETTLFGGLYPPEPVGSSIRAVEFRSDDHATGTVWTFYREGSEFDYGVVAGGIQPTSTGYVVTVPLSSTARNGYPIDLRDRSYYFEISGYGGNPASPSYEDHAVSLPFAIS